MARDERKGIMPRVLPILEQLLGRVALIAGIFSGLLAGSFLMMKVLAPKLKSATGRKELLYGQPALKHDRKPQALSLTVSILKARYCMNRGTDQNLHVQTALTPNIPVTPACRNSPGIRGTRARPLTESRVLTYINLLKLRSLPPKPPKMDKPLLDKVAEYHTVS